MMRVLPVCLARSTSRTSSSCLVVGRPAHRLLTTTTPGQAKAAPRSATKLDAFSGLETDARGAGLKLARCTPRCSSRTCALLRCTRPITFRTSSSCLVVGRPAYRLLTTNTPGQEETAPLSSVKDDASSTSETETREAELELAENQGIEPLQPPKRPGSIYNFVCRDALVGKGRLTVDEFQECMRLARERYRSLSAEETQSYQAELDWRRRVYEVEMRQYLDSLTSQDHVNQNESIPRLQAKVRRADRRVIPKLDPKAPKPPQSGYNLFCADLRADPTKFSDFPGFPTTTSNSFADQSKVLAAYWREMDDDVKQGYSLEAQRQRDSYKQEMEQYVREQGLAEKHEVQWYVPPEQAGDVFQLVEIAKMTRLTECQRQDCLRLAVERYGSSSDEESKTDQVELD